MKICELSERLIYSSPWMGYDIQDQYAPFYEKYLYRILSVVESSTRQYRKIFIIRFDLHLPFGFDEADTAIISRFMASLGSQMHEDYVRHAQSGVYLNSCRLRFVWAKERGYQNEGIHYHVCIFLNHKRYAALGNYTNAKKIDTSEVQRNMAFRICKAWMSATYGLASSSLVHFPSNSSYVLDREALNFEAVRKDLFYRLSYLAKVYSKEFVTGRRFGSSRG